MSSEYFWDLVAANNIQRRAVGKNWTVKNRCRDNAKKIWLDRKHSTKKSKRNLPQNGTRKEEDHVDAPKPPGGALFWRNVGKHHLANYELKPKTATDGI
jgi:hypothetical protein